MYGVNGGTEAYLKFVRSLFEVAISPYYFETEFISSIMSNYNQYSPFPISTLELSGISTKYLNGYLNSIKTLDRHAFILFWHTQYVSLQTFEDGRVYTTQIIPTQAKTIMKEFILKKDLRGFMERIIEYDMPGRKTYRIANTAEVIFETWDKFEREVIDLIIDPDPYGEEFVTFYKAIKTAGYRTFIPFDFSVIPVKSD